MLNNRMSRLLILLPRAMAPLRLWSHPPERVLIKIRDARFRGRSGSPTRPRGCRLLTQSGLCAVSVRPLSLGELAPCSFCGPPYEPAATDNEYAQRNPSIDPCGN